AEATAKATRQSRAQELDDREKRARAIESIADGWLLPPKAVRAEFTDVYGHRYFCRPATNADRAALTRAGAASNDRPIIYTAAEHAWLIESERPDHWPQPGQRYVFETGASEAEAWRRVGA